jgi:hypothetical protein
MGVHIPEFANGDTGPRDAAIEGINSSPVDSRIYDTSTPLDVCAGIGLGESSLPGFPSPVI